MINISWSQFEKNQLAKDISFESFCFQTAYILYKDYGFFENFYNTPGSEFYLTLHKDCEELNLKSGDEIGWQVKWWFDSEENTSLTSVRRKELVKGFNTTLSRHPDIKLWVICTPGNFVESTFIKLKKDLTDLSTTTNFSHWNKVTFTNFSSNNFSKFGDVFNHYFNSHFIGFDFVKKYSQRRIDDLNKKFDTDLYTPSHYDDEILFLINYKKIYTAFENKIKYLQDTIDDIIKNNLFIKTDYKYFTNEYISEAYELLNLSVNTARYLIDLITSKMNLEKGNLLFSKIEQYIKERKILAEKLNKKLNNKSYLRNEEDNDTWEINHHNEYLIESINKIQNHIIVDGEEDKKIDSFLDIIEGMCQKDLHILSSAGYGKTNIACNICEMCLKNNIPCLLILGSSFRKSDLPQKIILELLELDTKYTFKELLQALNTLGLFKGFKIPIIIDGLNESTPYNVIWKNNIKDIIRDVNDLDNVIFITTCRDRYIEAIFDETDILKIPNTKSLEGFNENNRDVAVKKYFTKYEINPSSWNFNKDLFKNPLLLKIFSEINKNKSDIHISLDNIFISIESYVNIILQNASTVCHTADPILKKVLKSRIEDFCKVLWDTKRREIPLQEFHNIIDPGSTSLIGSLTEKLLAEGLCFQRNLTTENETVQFTYDLIAGYSIASKVLLNPITTTKDLLLRLEELNIEDKLFRTDTEHPLRQDILMSLLHLLPVRFEVNIFELYDNKIVIEECFNSIDYFIDNEDGQEKLFLYISRQDKNTRNFKLLFEKLFENIFKKEIHGQGALTIRILSLLTQAEVDIFWTELIRKNRDEVYQYLNKTNKNYFRNKSKICYPEQDLHQSFLSTTSSDKSLRSLATENLFLIAKKHQFEFIKLSKQALSFKDLNSLESLIVAMCGSVLSIKNETYTKTCLDFIIEEFLPYFKHTHICIIDYITTIFEFALECYNIDYISKLNFDINHFKIKKDKETIATLSNGHSIHFPNLFGLDLYEFNKYQISKIVTDNDYKRKTYSSIECFAIISSNIKSKGYDADLFNPIHKEFNEDIHFKYGKDKNENLTFYTEKYLWQAYFELVGSLVLNKKLKSEDENRYRCEDVFFDPTFPRLPQRFQIINDCFCPTYENTVQKWIDSTNQNFIDDFLTHKLYTDFDWILLSSDITQERIENQTRFNFSLDSFLIPKEKINNFKKEIENKNFYYTPSSYSHIYAGEIDWSKFVQKNDNEYYEERFNVFDVMHQYSWSGWSNERFETPYFKFLNPKLSKKLDLLFNSEDLSFYDTAGNQITKIVWTKSTKLYYARKEFFNEILDKMGLELVWVQFVSKYGEFGEFKEHKLNPSYKYLKRMIKFNNNTSNL